MKLQSLVPELGKCSAQFFHKGDRTNQRGNTLHDFFTGNYEYDMANVIGSLLHDNWSQYLTDQDAAYFGVWVNFDKNMIMTYAEGDLTVCVCGSNESMTADYDDMQDFYRCPQPPIGGGYFPNKEGG